MRIMSESSTNVKPNDKKETLKWRKSESTNQHIKVNVEVVDGADGAKTDLQDLAALLKQGFAQMSQDIAKTIAESFKVFRSEFDQPYEDIAEDELGEILHAVDEDHGVTREAPCKEETRWLNYEHG